MQEALTQNAPHLSAVRQALERVRHDATTPHPLPLTLPDDPRLKNMVLTPRSLAVYDNLQGKKEEK